MAITVTVHGRCARGDYRWGLYSYVRLGLTLGSTTYMGSTQTLSGTKNVYYDYYEVFNNNPTTGNPWTWAEAQGIVGAVIYLAGHRASGWEREGRCTQLDLTVEEDGASQTLRPIGQGACLASAYGDSPQWKCIDDVIPDENATYIYYRGLTGGIGYEWSQNYFTINNPVSPPSVTTDPASDIANDEATLNGTLDDDGGEACGCGFEWGETEAYGNTTPTQSRTTGQNFAQTITGLDPNTTYHFRAFATNAAGTSYGSDRTFKTLTVLPTVTTDPATGIGQVSAALNGTLDNDGGLPCECGFEWGLDTSYGTITLTQTKTIGQNFAFEIRSLVPGTAYHFRAFATNMFGTSYGADREFTTDIQINRAHALSREEL